ncbi:MAG: ferrochelatase [Candidatus Omnitrophica bacterium]|nr:ferrochelatase [Candidatus Omnitrophota bacterium]
MPYSKCGVLLVNIGSPESPSKGNVKKYLRDFLLDPWVINLTFWQRWVLVHGVILPFYASSSSKLYRSLWTEQGFPLKVYTEKLKIALQTAIGPKFDVRYALRYQNPSLQTVLASFKDCQQLLIVPLFPQYASSTTGSLINAVEDILKNKPDFPQVKFIQPFFNNPFFIKSFVSHAHRYLKNDHYDHYLFSYHGLPKSHLKKLSPHYQEQCFETTNLLVKEFGLKEGEFTTCFQSRLGFIPWTRPYTDEIIKQLAKRGVKKILVVAPSFVTDCLETIQEIGIKYKNIFLRHGGETLNLVGGLNDDPCWVDGLKQIIIEGGF